MLSSAQFGGSENIDVFIQEGAGGPFHLPGTYVWQNHRMPYAEAGQWGYLRVLPVGDKSLLPINSGTSGLGSRTAEEPSAPSGTGPVSMLEKSK